MNHVIRNTLKAMLGLWVAGAALAQDRSSFEARTGYPLPQAGAYYDPAQSGTGLFVDFGLDGTVFAALMVYEPDGRPTFYTLQGPLDRSSVPADRPEALGVLRSPLYRSRNGPCLGCAPGTATTEQAREFGIAQVLFSEARRAEVSVGGTQWRMDRMEIDLGPAEFAAGQFLLAVDETVRDGTRHQFITRVSSVASAQRPSAIVIGDPDPACGTQPRLEYVDRELICQGDCAAFQRWAGDANARVVLWRNLDSTSFQLARVVPGAGGFATLPHAPQFTLAMDAYTISALPAARGCRAAPGAVSALRLFRDPAPTRQVGVSGFPWPRDLFTLRPGFYWNPATPGAGLFVDRSAQRVDGGWSTAFAVLFGYDDRGRPDFQTLQGTVYLSDQFGFRPSGFDSPAYVSRGGQCIGCAWRPAVTQADPAMGRFSVGNWSTASNNIVDLSLIQYYDNQTARAVAIPGFALDRPATDNVIGRWLFRVDLTPALVPPEQVEAIVDVVALDAAAARSALFGGRPAYRLHCVRSCADFDAWRAIFQAPTRDVLLWFACAAGQSCSPVSAKLGLYTPTPGGYVELVRARTFEIETVMLDRMRAHSDNGAVQFYRNPPDALSD